ncbi:hypothetical protein SISSUDRAFT_203461 [Sistotremastrum suecicum HHB10207 ss-3]|uniref:Uncharacterized protein n=1 Tax=Sistotremastrum suecicum HHB10207 ss-3 TaxID=1314776 RepID=A0A166GL89_9AGAM|nr:hypothetical protein SISSUDRAFT_203461 [Sistotremastrum suecicum HHB10207 ss-3]
MSRGMSRPVLTLLLLRSSLVYSNRIDQCVPHRIYNLPSTPSRAHSHPTPKAKPLTRDIPALLHPHHRPPHSYTHPSTNPSNSPPKHKHDIEDPEVPTQTQQMSQSPGSTK